MVAGPGGRRPRLPRRLRRLHARRRLRQINARRVQRALSGALPSASSQPGAVPDVVTTYGSPRSLLYMTVKRDNTSWRALYGHWWVELDDEESYGWWPATVPLRVRDLVRGTDGVLNGVGLLAMKGTWSRDPNHGQPAAHAFHPVLQVVKSDEQVRSDVRRFARGYRTRWRWHWSPRRTAGTCRGFQDDLFAAVGLVDGAGQVHTRGSGCPFLYQVRRPCWWFADRLDGARPGTPAGMPMKGTSFPRVSAVRSVVIDRPMEQTLELVRDIELLEPLERKARAVEVHPESATSGWYRIHGRLMRLAPWTGDFSFVQSENGWHSADLHCRADGWRISGGFVVTPVNDDSCRVTHYEDYVPPRHLRWMHPVLVVYMRLSQIGEMRDLKRLVETRVPPTGAASTSPAGSAEP